MIAYTLSWDPRRDDKTGEFTFTWKDDDGSEYTTKNKLTVG